MEEEILHRLWERNIQATSVSLTFLQDDNVIEIIVNSPEFELTLNQDFSEGVGPEQIAFKVNVVLLTGSEHRHRIDGFVRFEQRNPTESAANDRGSGGYAWRYAHTPPAPTYPRFNKRKEPPPPKPVPLSRYQHLKGEPLI